jgi:hypothetical protein
MKGGGTSMSSTLEVDTLAEDGRLACAAFDGDAVLDFDAALDSLDMTELRFVSPSAHRGRRWRVQPASRAGTSSFA